MEIEKTITTPTGHILIGSTPYGKLEFLSLADYGQEKNIKADFLGLSREIDGVPHGDLMPLEKKWVITISTQFGCSMGCQMCMVPKVGPGKNIPLPYLRSQIEEARKLHPEITNPKRINIHFARMGEPTFNFDVIDLAMEMKDDNYFVHPVVSTMMPRHNTRLDEFIREWCHIKNWYYNGNAGLQLSINTTDENERRKQFNNNALTLEEIGNFMNKKINFHSDCHTDVYPPRGRKYTLNFALTNAEINPLVLKKYFDPRYWICKITPMHETDACIENNLITKDGYEYYYPYKDVEESLKSEGYDVLVFIPSKEEDVSKITCGNLLLSHF